MMSNNKSSSSSIPHPTSEGGGGQQPPKILWSAVTRGETILAEAAFQEHPRISEVAQTAKELLSKKNTPGFEFHTQGNRLTNMIQQTKKSDPSHRPLKGIKFHVYEHSSDDGDGGEGEGDAEWANTNEAQLRVWVFAAVYDPLQVTVKAVQSFLEKMVTLTENLRQYDPDWRSCDTLGLQPTFAPILKQRMEEVTYLGDMALLDQKIQACQLQMESNIEMILYRGERLEDLNEDANRLQEVASVFKKKAKRVRRLKMMQNAKHGLIVGTAITAGVSLAVIPPLVAIL